MTQTNQNTQHYDLTIVGGGLVGTALALALAAKPLKIALVEKKNIAAPDEVKGRGPLDKRSLALSFISQRILQGLGVWHSVQEQACPIQQVHISNQGHFGFTRIKAQDYHVSALGYSLGIEILHASLQAKLRQATNVTLISPASVTALDYLYISQNNPKIRLTLQQQDQSMTLQTDLLIGADGANSTIRDLLAIKTQTITYQQVAVVGTLVLQNTPPKRIAYERFTRTGPLALLPVDEKRYAFVWTVSPQQGKVLIDLNPTDFIDALQQAFGFRLGKFSASGQRQMFPLKLIQAKEQIRSNVALLGNACHSLHPVAGQGFNLGLRDVAVMAQCIDKAMQRQERLNQVALLQDYAKERAFDQRLMLNFTHALIRIFSNDYKALSLGRNIVLLGLDYLPFLKKGIARRLMGFNGNLPNLALGLPV